MNRREFLAAMGTAATGAGISTAAEASPAATPDASAQMGLLVDTTECIGCRKCEYACARANHIGNQQLEHYEDTAAFEQPRRMVHDAYTVVNRYPNPDKPERPIYVKVQCMHCQRPACVSACIVGALHQETNGSVSYDAWKCIGCRYCMLACPFEVPTYEYHKVLTPVVSKCNFCYDEFQMKGKIPACAEMCPPNCLTYGNRADLLAMAHEKIAAHPGRYVDHVYGETEAGGTAWLYLTSRPITELGLLALPDKPVPQLTETLQHGIFKYGLPPMLLFGVLATAMKVFKPENETGENPSSEA